MPLTNQGLPPVRHSDILDEIDGRYLEDTGLQLDSQNPDNAKKLLQRLNGYIADIGVTLHERLVAVYDAFLNPEASQGVQASNIAKITGTERKLGSASTITIDCAGTDGTVLGTGVIIRGGSSDPTATWASTEDATITGGSVPVVFQAQDVGAKTAEPGTAWEIVTPRSGWASATNPTVRAAVGTEDEDDGALHQRRKLSVAARAGAGIPGLRARLLNLSFVQTVAIASNGDSETRVINGVSMRGNSHLVVILPNQLTEAQEQRVLDTMYDSIVGTSFHVGNDVQATVQELSDGNTWPLGYDYGEELDVTLAFTITTRSGASEADARAALGRDVRSRLLPLQLGEELLQIDLCGIAGDTQLIKSVDVLIQGVDADFQALFNQRVSSFTITVNGVDVPAEEAS